MRFTQTDQNTCIIDGTLDGLTPGEHGLAIHECGDLSGGCTTVGDHYNPRLNVLCNGYYGSFRDWCTKFNPSPPLPKKVHFPYDYEFFNKNNNLAWLGRYMILSEWILHMWLVGCLNPNKMEQSWECISLNIFTHIKAKLEQIKNLIIGLPNH